MCLLGGEADRCAVLGIAAGAPLGAGAGAAGAWKREREGQAFSASALLPFGAGSLFALKKYIYGCMCMYENQDACVDKIDTSFRIAVSSEQGEYWSAIRKGFFCLSGISSLSNRKAMVGTPL